MTGQKTSAEVDAQRFRFWSTIMVAICFAIGVIVYGAGRYSFGVFMKPLAETMSWSRTEISLAATIHLVFYAVSSPVVGWLFDSLGTRKVMLVGSATLTLSLCSMYFTSSLLGLYFFYGVLAAVGSNGVGRLSEATIVSNWFIKRRGLMLGITAVAVGLGTAIMAPLVRLLLDQYGWQKAFVAIGIIVALFIWLPVLVLIKGRGKPEDRGFGPDGLPLELAQNNNEIDAVSQATVSVGDWRVSDALRTSAFWIISIAMGLCYMADYLVLFHGPASIEDRGFTGTSAAFVLSIATLSSCLGRIGFGWLADRASVRLGFGLMFGIQIASTPLLIMNGGINVLYCFALVWGIGYGAASVYLPYVISLLFGRSAFSSIYGWATMITVLGGSFGGVLGGLIFDNTGSYLFAWYLCATLWLTCLLMIQFALSDSARSKLKVLADARPIS